MSPDTPALRGLLAAIDTALNVPLAAHPCDDDLRLAELTARAQMARHVMRGLLEGPLDNCAIQQAGQQLGGLSKPVHYQVRAA